jgi:hypothetical protein
MKDDSPRRQEKPYKQELGEIALMFSIICQTVDKRSSSELKDKEKYFEVLTDNFGRLYGSLGELNNKNNEINDQIKLLKNELSGLAFDLKARDYAIDDFSIPNSLKLQIALLEELANAQSNNKNRKGSAPGSNDIQSPRGENENRPRRKSSASKRKKSDPLVPLLSPQGSPTKKETTFDFMSILDKKPDVKQGDTQNFLDPFAGIDLSDLDDLLVDNYSDNSNKRQTIVPANENFISRLDNSHNITSISSLEALQEMMKHNIGLKSRSSPMMWNITNGILDEYLLCIEKSSLTAEQKRELKNNLVTLEEFNELEYQLSNINPKLIIEDPVRRDYLKELKNSNPELNQRDILRLEVLLRQCDRIDMKLKDYGIDLDKESNKNRKPSNK